MASTRSLSPWNSKDYLSFLKAFFAHHSTKGRGIKAEVARAARCSTAYLSHVLAGQAQLTPEQALGAVKVFGLTALEQRYFFYLVLRDRAGSPELKSLLNEELRRLKNRGKNIATRFDLREKPPLEVESRYYSRWYFSAIRVCLYVPAFRNISTLAQMLRLRLETVRKAMEFLQEAQLVSETPVGWMPTEVNFHLDQSSPSVFKHHSHWRLRALANLEEKQIDDIHYTSLISISKKDRDKVQEILLQAIADIRQLVGRSSPEEEVHCYLIDSFPVATGESF